jgi:RNA polymerase sigma-70 factor (ECF subfamily)
MSVMTKAEPGSSPPGSGDPGLNPGVRAGTAQPEDFARLTDPFRPELLAHCYRMLGSVHDAEDQVQETLIRAWRSFGQFQGRASLRTWLYQIATNECLRAIEKRGRRPLPSGLGAPGEHPEGPMADAMPEVPWLQPIPDALLRPDSADPASVAASRTNIRLALIAALQYLPARQRAVLILRDVLGWRAAEVAELLGTTTAAANGVLQRARAQLQQAALTEDEIREPADPRERALLNRYAAAFENADISALTQLLRDDAVMEMPPLPTWFTGREQIGRFLHSHVLRQPGDFIMIPTAANGQPALAEYRCDHDGVHRAHAVQVLTLTASRVARVIAFLDPGLFAAFGLPAALPAALATPAPRQ